MNQLEHELRAGLRAVAGEIPAGTVPPLRLPATEARRDGRDPGDCGPGDCGPDDGWRGSGDRAFTGEHRPRPRRWTAATAAAAALFLVAAGIFGLVALARRAPSPARPASAVLPVRVPPYYVALHLTQASPLRGPSYAAVTSTATGAVVATVRPPTPFTSFQAVAGAADDTTFVLAATTTRPRRGGGLLHLPATKFFRLTIDPAAPARADRARLAPLAVPVQPAGTLVEMALAPDGTKLAVASETVTALRKWQQRLTVYDLSAGTRRSWLVPTGFQLGNWLADDRTLSFSGAPVRDDQWAVLLLDTSAHGGSFAADTRAVARLASSPGVVWRQVSITPDGRTLLVARTTPGGRYPIFGVNRVQRYSVMTGRPAGLVDVRKVELGESDEVQWSDLTGRVLVMLVPQVPGVTGPGVHTDLRAVVMAGGSRSEIPWSATATTGAW